MSEIKNEQRKRIGERLKEIRTEQGWSQEQVALMAGVTERTVEKVEQGAFNVPLDVLATLSDVLGYELRIGRKEAGV
jgi:transcriptional regulator with XRE-family HTH domain